MRNTEFRKDKDKYKKHVEDNLFDWVGNFENLEKFFINSTIGQFLKTLTAANLKVNSDKTYVYEPHGFVQKNLFKKLQEYENDETPSSNYFYFFWDFNIMKTVVEIIELDTFDSQTYYGFTDLARVTTYSTPLHHPELVTADLALKLSH